MFTVGDSVWHTHFFETDQMTEPGRITSVLEERVTGEVISCGVMWPDGVFEYYQESELSLTRPDLKPKDSIKRMTAEDILQSPEHLSKTASFIRDAIDYLSDKHCELLEQDPFLEEAEKVFALLHKSYVDQQK